MARHEDIVSLRQMLESAQIVSKKISAKTLDALLSDSDLQDILARRLEIIGEAAKRLTDQMKNRYPEIPWLDIIGLRNRLIHGYDEVDYGVLWDIASNDIPPLISQLSRILSHES